MHAPITALGPHPDPKDKLVYAPFDWFTWLIEPTRDIVMQMSCTNTLICHIAMHRVYHKSNIWLTIQQTVCVCVCNMWTHLPASAPLLHFTTRRTTTHVSIIFVLGFTYTHARNYTHNDRARTRSNLITKRITTRDATHAAATKKANAYAHMLVHARAGTSAPAKQCTLSPIGSAAAARVHATRHSAAGRVSRTHTLTHIRIQYVSKALRTLIASSTTQPTS